MKQLLIGLAIAICLSACGKRPGQLDLPDGVTNDHFPHSYPSEPR
ncbi:MAG: hypothetical protein U9N14_03030 [Pseudomonadota bacterium]|nr:hypothetical protein [Pseudomonadota bacterium]